MRKILIYYLLFTIDLLAENFLKNLQDNSIIVTKEGKSIYVKRQKNKLYTKEYLASKPLFGGYQKNYKKIFKLFGIKEIKEGLNFSKAKTLLLFCNGSWCSQSPNAIMSLVNNRIPNKKASLVNI